MDRAVFVGMNALQQVRGHMSAIANNMANSKTTSFKEQQNLVGQKLSNQNSVLKPRGARSYAYATEFTNFAPGPLMFTNNKLDIAVDDRLLPKGTIGFVAIKKSSGENSFLRSGTLGLNRDGLLVTQEGSFVLGEGGPISLSEAEDFSISSEGVVSGYVKGDASKLVKEFDRLKLVGFSKDILARQKDGSFAAQDGSTGTRLPDLHIVTGALEGSNANTVDQLTRMMDVSQKYDMQLKMMRTIHDLSDAGNALLRES
jgi:flagellar basal-body rod protein FlgF